MKQFSNIFKQINRKLTVSSYNTPGWGLGIVNTNYHKSINKVLISRNYFDGAQKELLLRNNLSEHPGFAVGISWNFGKDMTNTWNIWLVINKVIHSVAAVMQNRIWQTSHKD
jgi:hypothetical protein